MALPDLDILVAVVELGSLSAAAEQLAIPRPTLSRRLGRLEDTVGATLVRRTSRQAVPTEAGLELYRHARPIIAAIQTATQAVRVRDGVPRGLLRVSVPTPEDPVGPVLAEFMRRYPEVRLEVNVAARHVDMVAEGFDVALRAGTTLNPALIARRLGRQSVGAVASPTYLRQQRPSSPDKLVQCDCLVGFERGEVPARVWPLLDGSTVPVRVRFSANDPRLLLHAALAGQGIAMLADIFTRRPLAEGLLEPVLPEHLGTEGGVWIVFPEKRLMLPQVRAFIDFAAEHLRPLAEDPGGQTSPGGAGSHHP